MQVHITKIAKLKNSEFPLEQENALHVYQGQELDVATKWWQQTHSRVNRQSEHLKFSLTKSEYVIYLLECILCKIQYVGKAETALNLDNWKDTKKPNYILACKYFQKQGHDFNKHTKFIIIDKLINLHDSKETLREMLVVRENFWIQKLKMLVPFGLNQELSQ